MADPLFDGAGALVADYAAVDWASTPLGPPESWSPTLRLTVALVIETRFPVSLFWGAERVLIYNEAYAALMADKHPSALGGLTREVFAEAWEQIRPMMEASFAGEAVYLVDAPVPLVRRGFLEECYFTFCYSPVRARNGTVEGVIDIATETTEQVISRRRIDLLGRLAAQLSEVDTADDVVTASVGLLRASTDDLAAVDVRGTATPVAPEPRLPAAPRTDLGERDLLLELHDARPVAWLPLHPGADAATPVAERPVLVVETSPLLPLDDDYLLFLKLVASTMGQAIDRVEALALERRAAAAEREVLEALQRTLLTPPVATGGVRVAARYQPAQHLAQIGGDWHDTFALPGGTTAVVVGDVAGHDREAAAGMAQVKNLLRGIAFGVDPDPARVLAAVDHAMVGLEVGTLATAVLGFVEPHDGGYRLLWSNAGHPPPVVLCPDGRADLLTAEPELVLGLEPDTERTSHHLDLAPGTTVVLYTDGLVERRGTTLEEGIARMTATMTGGHGLEPEELCDLLLEHALPDADDDVALVVVRVESSVSGPRAPG